MLFELILDKNVYSYYRHLTLPSFFNKSDLFSILFEGLSWELARGTIRLSTSYMTTDDEIDEAIILTRNAVKQQLSSFTNGHD
jgi:hypothetical protein